MTSLDTNSIIVVTGLARSGTTMMMRMLEAGGVELYYDQSKPLYFDDYGTQYINYSIILRETEKVLLLKGTDSAWLEECRGKAVKILNPLKYTIPKTYPYKFIYMDRGIKHMVNSQRKFFKRDGKKFIEDPNVVQKIMDAKAKIIRTFGRYPGSSLMVSRFENVLDRPKAEASRVKRFLGLDLDIGKMVSVVVKRPARCMPDMMEERIYAV